MSSGLERAGDAPLQSRPPLLDAVLTKCENGLPDAQAWDAFLGGYSRLLLHVASRTERQYDERMNLYAHVVGELCRDGCRRLRAYEPTSGARFTTWLAVVAQRLCVDYYRRRYGRGDSVDDGVTRRRLADLVCEQLDPESTVDQDGIDPELEARRAELLHHLHAAVHNLEPNDRLILNLRFVDGRSAREIAAVLGASSPWQIYRAVDRILKQLREALNGRGVLDATP